MKATTTHPTRVSSLGVNPSSTDCYQTTAGEPTTVATYAAQTRSSWQITEKAAKQNYILTQPLVVGETVRNFELLHFVSCEPTEFIAVLSA